MEPAGVLQAAHLPIQPAAAALQHAEGLLLGQQRLSIQVLLDQIPAAAPVPTVCGAASTPAHGLQHKSRLQGQVWPQKESSLQARLAVSLHCCPIRAPTGDMISKLRRGLEMSLHCCATVQHVEPPAASTSELARATGDLSAKGAHLASLPQGWVAAQRPEVVCAEAVWRPKVPSAHAVEAKARQAVVAGCRCQTSSLCIQLQQGGDSSRVSTPTDRAAMRLCDPDSSCTHPR